MMARFSQKATFGLRLSPFTVLSARLLQMSGAELDDAVRAELEENPALERVSDFEPVLSLGRSTYSERRGQDAVNRLEDCRPLDALESELRTSTPVGEQQLAIALLHSLDERGYLATPTYELAEAWQVPVDEVERALAGLHGLDIPGLGARTLQECLVLQCNYLSRLGVDCGIVPRVLTEGWGAFVDQRWRDLALELGVGPDAIRGAIDFIRRELYPYPIAMVASGLPSQASAYSDVVVRPDELNSSGPLSVELPARTLHELRLSAAFAGASERAAAGDDTGTDWALSFVRRAKDFMASLDRRWETLQRIAEFVVEYQRAYVLGTARWPRPLTRRVLATELDLHESTVSRAISDKTAQLPSGRVVPLTSFFGSRAFQDEIEELLLRQVDEDLCDREVAEALRGAGLVVSRRTVAKYRSKHLRVVNGTRGRLDSAGSMVA